MGKNNVSQYAYAILNSNEDAFESVKRKWRVKYDIVFTYDKLRVLFGNIYKVTNVVQA